MTPPGYVRLICAEFGLDVLVLLGPEPVAVTAGLGGWAVTARPRQVGMTTWEGVEPLQVQLAVMFDGYAAGASQETALGRLFSVARGDDESEPGQLTVEGVMLPTVAAGWVIEDLEYGDPILHPANMERLRQPVTLTLREYVEPKFLAIRKSALKGSKGKTRIIVAHKNETVAHLARRAKCTFKQLRALNAKLCDKANKKLKAGTKVRAPVPVTKPVKPARPARGRSRSQQR